jgi:hypothetical protein
MSATTRRGRGPLKKCHLQLIENVHFFLSLFSILVLVSNSTVLTPLLRFQNCTLKQTNVCFDFYYQLKTRVSEEISGNI